MTARACPGVEQIVAADNLGAGIRKQWKRKTHFLTEGQVGFHGVNTHSHHSNVTLAVLVQLILEAP